eukprot:TRINITY_DN8462_c0_g1_i1.p1 TRINITY_DN8462_c0_g1~~TRINITY_DN8462_c0_g1_i1.p1  ORF type:complete len:190 (-),score=30.62 TRINITY_DN8462_c0_g1_i1:89-622(-)
MFEDEQEQEEYNCKGFVPFSIHNTPQMRHVVGSFLSGGLFTAAWLLAVDGAILGEKWEGYKSPPWFMWIPGGVSSFVLLMMNIVSVNDIHPYTLLFDANLSQKVRFWLFLTFALGFGAIIAIIWMMVDEYNGMDGFHIWPGLCLVLQNVFIFSSGLIFLLSRRISPEEGYDEVMTGF